MPSLSARAHTEKRGTPNEPDVIDPEVHLTIPCGLRSATNSAVKKPPFTGESHTPLRSATGPGILDSVLSLNPSFMRMLDRMRNRIVSTMVTAHLTPEVRSFGNGSFPDQG
jgi:hypothetical protein